MGCQYTTWVYRGEEYEPVVASIAVAIASVVPPIVAIIATLGRAAALGAAAALGTAATIGGAAGLGGARAARGAAPVRRATVPICLTHEMEV